MKTDPNTACANATERTVWAVLHDLVAHPLMAATNWCSLSMRFHDWTSRRAWPRVAEPISAESWQVFDDKWGTLTVKVVAAGFYSVDYHRVDHAVVVMAADVDHALDQADAWFQSLRDQHGAPY